MIELVFYLVTDWHGNIHEAARIPYKSDKFSRLAKTHTPGEEKPGAVWVELQEDRRIYKEAVLLNGDDAIDIIKGEGYREGVWGKLYEYKEHAY